MAKISVITKRPGEPPRHVWITNSLSALQKAVGGYIETITLPNGVVIICDEEGRLKGLPFNFRTMICDFVGPVVICGSKGCEFADLPISFEGMKRFMPQLWADVKEEKEEAAE